MINGGGFSQNDFLLLQRQVRASIRKELNIFEKYDVEKALGKNSS